MASKLLLLGSGAGTEHALQIAKSDPDLEVQFLEIFAPDRFNFELPDLTAYPPAEWNLFVALDDRALNVSRHQFVAMSKAAGYRLHRLVSADALVSQSATLGENTMVQKGAIVEANTKLGLNVVVAAGARIGADCKVGNGVYVDFGGVIGARSTIGDYVTVGAGARVEPETVVGRQCELRLPRTYRGEIPSRTFYFDRFENPVSIISPI